MQTPSDLTSIQVGATVSRLGEDTLEILLIGPVATTLLSDMAEVIEDIEFELIEGTSEISQPQVTPGCPLFSLRGRYVLEDLDQIQEAQESAEATLEELDYRVGGSR